MALMDFIKKQFIDIIQWTEDDGDTMAWRFPMAEMEIQNGASLTVRESQMAVFVNEGQVADVFGPGMYKLTTQTLPVLTYLKNWDKLFESPFKSDVYFFSVRGRSSTASGARRIRSPSATRISAWCGCAPSASTPST
jgi:membrane protease subunit (stomatin/prohibitin family)